MPSPSKTSAPLGERDVNAPVSPRKLFSQKSSGHSLKETSKSAPGFEKPTTNSAAGTYVSPSDAIMSPASQKLAGMKGRRFASAKPKSLFAKTVMNEHNSSVTASKLKEEADVGADADKNPADVGASE